MSLSPYTIVIGTKLDAPYNVIPNAAIEIRHRNSDGTSGAFANIFEDPEGLTPITQAGATVDDRGTLIFYAQAGSYNAVYNNGSSVTQPIDVGITASNLADKDYIAIKPLASAVADTSAQVGDYVRISDRDNTLAKYIAATTNDGIGLINATGSLTTIEIIANDDTTIISYGADNTGVADSSPAVQYLLNKGLTLKAVDGLFSFDSKITYSGDCTIKGNFKKTIFKSRHSEDHMFVLTNGNISFSGIKLVGNNLNQADGLKVEDAQTVEVFNNIFDGFGEDGGNFAQSPLRMVRVEDVTITGNFFLEDNIGVGGADIHIGYGVKNSTVTNNVSISQVDAFCFLAAVTYAAGDTVNHTVSNNVAIRPVGAFARHGVIIDYAGIDSYTTVTSNIFQGFNWTAVYAANQSVGTGGCCTVESNIIRNCGGDNGGATGTLSAGIMLSSPLGTTINGNIFEDTGTDADGFDRDFAVPAIKILSGGENLTINNNIIIGTTSYGIEILANSSSVDTMKRATIKGNTITGTSNSPMQILNANPSNTMCEKCIISHNVFDAGSFTAVAISATGAVGVMGDVTFEANQLISTGTGLYTNVLDLEADIKSNTFIGCTRGIYYQNASIGHLEFGDKIWVAGNTFKDCTTGLDISTSGTVWAMIGINHFSNTTNYTVGNVVEVVSEIKDIKKIRNSTAPTGTWPANWYLEYTDPVSTSFIGAKSDGAGTWTNYGAV